jgi:RNA polymerase II subunit A C-terminal domain phosphatase
LWAKSFGATISLNVNKHTTHVIANPDRKTTKVKKAARYPNIKIVTAEWMFQCCTLWQKVNEAPHMIEMDATDRGGSPLEELEDDSANNSGEEDSGDGPESPLAPDLSDDQWNSMHDELEQFLNDDSESDGSISDSERSVNSTDSQSDSKTSKRKRKRETESDGSEAEDSDVSTASKLQKRKRRTMERVTSLTNVVNADKSSGLPSPETTGPEEEQGEDDGKTFDPQGGGPDFDSDLDGGLEAEMMAEFEKSGSED